MPLTLQNALVVEQWVTPNALSMIRSVELPPLVKILFGVASMTLICADGSDHFDVLRAARSGYVRAERLGDLRTANVPRLPRRH